ncbi:MAG: 16S rRNA (guanine(966)-N(2))-methyltransferase RsmD [Lachnospiraceae bacterium]|nr:16S rRNA (guanine(966)-N(2))-methyltransferase RsmD [Lachnospiraceae bacterium]
MRVIAGSARSMPLKCPEGTDTRPTTDRIKETLFNILQGDIPDCVFADFFAGSGGIGIEALSRGARKAYFIENAAEAVSCIEHNIKFTKTDERAILLKKDFLSALNDIYEKELDIIFIDPPYKSGYDKRLLSVLPRMKYVTENTVIIVEAELKADFSYVGELGLKIDREKKYKTNKHVFISLL